MRRNIAGGDHHAANLWLTVLSSKNSVIMGGRPIRYRASQRGRMSSYGFEEADSHEESVRIRGHVKWFDAGKGYGFIVPDDPSQTGSRDVLLHVTSLRNMGRENALEGSIIVCDVVKRPKGWQVADIVNLDETSASPQPERPRRQFDGDSHGGGPGGFRRDRGGHDGPRRDSGGGGGGRFETVRTPRRPPAPRGPLERA